MVGASSAARFFAKNGELATRVSRMGAKGIGYGNRMMQAGLGSAATGMKGRLATGQALAGRTIMGASRYARNNPRRAAGIAASVTGAGAMAANRRRGSQNYPMY